MGAAVLLFASCTSAQVVQSGNTAQQEAADSLTAIQLSQRPLWIQQTPESAEFLYFTGMAEAASESEARNAAVQNGFAAAAGFYGNFIQSETIDHSVFIEDMSRTIAEATIYDDKTNSYTNAVISEVRAIEYYTETYRAPNNRLSYKVWALCRVSRQKAEEDLANFAKNISDRYSPLLDTPYDTMAAALHSYSAVLSALEQNPLYRAVAWYDSPDGRVGLYEYCAARINALANSISFAAIPYGSVQKGETLNTTVRISSSQFQRIGAALCRVNITVDEELPPSRPYTVGEDNAFSLLIYTDKLEAGKYNVQLELLLNEAAPTLRTNPSAGFSFEVTPLNTIRFIYQDNEAEQIGPKIQELVQRQGLLMVDSGAAYLALVKLEFSERQDGNYYIVQPYINISIELERDRTPLLTYTKRYSEFRQTTRNEALQRAYRNIESDLGVNFAEQIQGLGK
jgi:hypothetical protein